MANNKSAKKRIKINQRNNLKNRFYKSAVKTIEKSFMKDLQVWENEITSYDSPSVSLPIWEKEVMIYNLLTLKQTLSLLYSLLDKGTKRNVFSKNRAARQKSRLAFNFQKACSMKRIKRSIL